MAANPVDTRVGMAVISGRMFGTTPSQAAPIYLGWGTGADSGSIVTNAQKTDINTPATEARVAGTPSQVTTTRTNDTLQVTGTLTCAGSGKTITNLGLFDGAGTGSPPSGATLMTIFDGLSQLLNVGDSIAFTAQIQFTTS